MKTVLTEGLKIFRVRYIEKNDKGHSFEVNYVCTDLSEIIDAGLNEDYYISHVRELSIDIPVHAIVEVD